ncbi:hypothetical protein BDL97_18G088100 [Sphagnum fallax]|nr:hypothetical protein BDL97_18G088100 [Sphagnum fallax]
MDTICGFCNAKMWIKERSTKSNNHPQFSLCYENGKVLLSNLPATPQELEVLFTNKESSAVKFRDQIRMYNSVLAFTSLGAKVDESFTQLYIHDTKCEHQNRHAIMPSLDPTTLDRLLTMMYNINPYVEVFKMARDMMATKGAPMDLKLHLIASRTKDARRYNVPTANEVAALMVGNGSEAVDRRDVILAQQAGPFQRISELHVGYMALHYPLLFPYGEDGWHPNILVNVVVADADLDEDHARESELQRKHCNVTMAEFYSYRLQHRDTDGIALFRGLQDAITVGDTSAIAIGQRIILPSSFTVGPRHMVQNYQDAMAICRWAGCPDVFVTFTCNPQWLEIKRALLLEQQPQDRSDLVTRVFKIKLKELINDIHKNHSLGRTIVGIYPHTVEDVNRMISAELPNLETNKLAHEIVARCTMHGPCGAVFPNAQCMEEGKCKKQYPRKFQSETVTDVNGYPIYWRRDTGHTVVVHGIELDNRWVVPHNVYLSTKYDVHINVEVCNNIRAVKYLFKYVYKGHDRATVELSRQSDNATEGNVFDMHDRFPTVERLHYHLPNQQMVLFRNDDDVQEVATRSVISRTMLTEWFKTNQESEVARSLMFDQFPQQWVWNRKLKRWTLRKRGFAIGHMYYAHPTSGERYYLQMLLNCIKGATSYEHLRTMDGRVHDTFKDACIAMGLLANDNEWDQALEEAGDRALYEIDQVLMRNGHCLEDFPTLPKFNYIPFVHGGNRLVQEELAYDQHSLTIDADNAEDRLNDDQRNVYETILNAVTNKEGKLFFVFKIPIDLHDESTCNITQQMKVAELVRKTDLIIWDEAPMMHRRTFEVVDRTLRDLMQLDDTQATEKIFGGKTVVLGGDFRQILPVVPKGRREDICHSGDAMYLMQCNILAPKNINVDEVNNAILESVSEESHTYLSANSLIPTEEGVSVAAGVSMDSLYPVEFLNTLRFSGIANHELKLKVGVPILLLRNLNQSIGLCNGTRLIVKRLGNNVGKRVFIPRIIMSPSGTDWPFVLRRHQFPIRVAFAITINKSQGQTFNNVGVYLSSPVYSHG